MPPPPASAASPGTPSCVATELSAPSDPVELDVSEDTNAARATNVRAFKSDCAPIRAANTTGSVTMSRMFLRSAARYVAIESEAEVIEEKTLLVKNRDDRHQASNDLGDDPEA